MRIHLADATTSKGQRECLVDELYTSTLLSYQYKNLEKDFSPCWNSLVNTNLADLRPRVIIDSGAFTAWVSGKPINPKDYATWALEFDGRWRHKMATLQFMNLDVIGDQEGSWRNQAILEAMGMKPIPIITYNAQKQHLERALDNYSYIALGGLVPLTRSRDKLRSWLDYCFGFIMQRFRRSGVMPKVHLLGVTTNWTLQRYPCYSSDSSSWVACLRYGGGDVAGLSKIPRYKESSGAMAATLHVLRSEIRKFKQMEIAATNLWKSRGITFD